jgi:hypothetical protein
MRRPATNGRIEPKRHGAPRVARERRETERFESLVNELSTAMALAPANAVDREIDSWLGELSQALDLDRSAIYERSALDQPVRTTHTWLRPGFPPFPRNYDPEKAFRKSTEFVMAGNMLTFARPSDIPAENEDARRFVEPVTPGVVARIARSHGARGATFWKRDRAQTVRDSTTGSAHRTQDGLSPIDYRRVDGVDRS